MSVDARSILTKIDQVQWYHGCLECSQKPHQRLHKKGAIRFDNGRGCDELESHAGYLHWYHQHVDTGTKLVSILAYHECTAFMIIQSIDHKSGGEAE